ncbi:hypothetical protein XBKB1_2460001 [Xenorhabdus bovienii str. kraussei Becker Underwood]|uniref:Uncharacterized protein n=1 Tax=Xenorhabdus bovienii str. kraussei Becker Underwood TaxID=1398204 RepID=A0A077PT41_XENBV|nr:hypothetical protein XBKB1_2460001 [Xenorhabdus bovienii str. kraussei Becker Underwood]
MTNSAKKDYYCNPKTSFSTFRRYEYNNLMNFNQQRIDYVQYKKQKFAKASYSTSNIYGGIWFLYYTINNRKY